MKASITRFEFKCYRQLLRIPDTEHKSNEEVKKRIELEAGKIVNLLELVRKRKIQWFGLVVRLSGDSLGKIILQGMVDGKRNRGRCSPPSSVSSFEMLFSLALSTPCGERASN